MQDSMVFYKSFYDAIKSLDDNTQLDIYNAIFAYALEEKPAEDLSVLASAIFTLIKPQLDANIKRREAGKKGAEHGKKGGRPKKKNPIGVIENEKEKTPLGLLEKTPMPLSNETPNVNVNVNDNVNDNKKINNIIPPKLEWIKEYCKERGNKIDAETFYDFYESKNWFVGKTKMKDWQACVRTWEKNRNDKSDGMQRTKYDFNELQKMIDGG